MESLAGKIEVKKLCEIFEEISKAKGKRQSEILSQFFEENRKKGQNLRGENPHADISMFPIVRLFMPKQDKERGPHGLKEKSIGLLFVKIFCLGKTSTNAQKLLKYKEPTNGASTMNDFAERVYWVLKPLLKKSCSMTVEELNTSLDTIAQKNATNEAKNLEFQKLIDNCGPLEIKWITRLILKDIKLGLGLSRILKTYHPDAEHVYSENANIRHVCDTLLDRSIKIGKKISGITLLQPFKPMLLERLEVKNIGKFFQNGNYEFIVQTKFDGERSQLHMKNGKFKYYTRHGTDITDNPAYGESKISGGFLTGRISDLLNPNCRSIILDGELMGWHKKKRDFSTKGVPFDVKKLTSKSCHQPCFIAYDIVLYNDKILIDEPLIQRLKILEEAFEDSEGVMMKCKNINASSVDELLKLYNDIAVDKKEEGLVLKDANGTYKPNVREGSGCYKIKAEYSEDLVHDIDVAIIGGYYGEGKHAGSFSTFLVAVVVPPISEKSEHQFFSVVSVSTGIPDAKLIDLSIRFAPHWTKEKPDCIVGPKKDFPNVWIHPRNSTILQLRAMEMIRTASQPTGLTFRGPRVIKIRDDKPWTDVCTLRELKSLVNGSGCVQKLIKRHATTDDIVSNFDSPPKKKLRQTGNLMKVDKKFLGIRSLDVICITRLFEGKEFCVMNGEESIMKDEKLTKTDLEKIVLEHSGKIIQNASEKTFCVIVGNRRSERVKNLMSSRKYDIVKIDWLLRATEKKNWKYIQDFYPWEIISSRKSTTYRLANCFDEYYDSYTEDADEKMLERSLERMERLGDVPECSQENFTELETEMYETSPPPFLIFRDLVGYFTDDSDPNKFLFRFMDGKIAERIDMNVTHIFIREDSVKTSDLYREINLSGRTSTKIFYSRWINECFVAKEVRPEIDEIYAVK